MLSIKGRVRCNTTALLRGEVRTSAAVAARNVIEILVRGAELLRDAQVRDHDQIHARRAVVGVVVFPKSCHGAGIAMVQGFGRSGVEAAEHGIVPGGGTQHLPNSPALVRFVLLVLRIDCVQLTADQILLEERSDEELSEAVHTFFESGMPNLVVVHCLFLLRVGIRVAIVEGHEVVKGGLIWILLGAQEEQMLTEVCKTGEGHRVVERPSLNSDREAGLGCTLVLDHKHLQAILRESHALELSMIGQRFLHHCRGLVIGLSLEQQPGLSMRQRREQDEGSAEGSKPDRADGPGPAAPASGHV
mmetsp:Transcript_82793/g.268172  ORF Transcript_82793/g.268172 Transcript_82793/m.268172 type:complete len:303 (-) Transcript_82793:62-970(-)